ncbi:Photosystem I assembly protein Ycf4 [Platanthera guangdongensis]|uniref:Photosystem I assembly protein Ycf4 n=1 Tax=Platanthera guangdongensis TaxID=2320717 RepID=A0ABR2LDU2_9ASPA
MSFYGIAGLFISSYLWCTISWNVGSDYERFDRKEEIMCLFRWRFTGINSRSFSDPKATLCHHKNVLISFKMVHALKPHTVLHDISLKYHL